MLVDAVEDDTKARRRKYDNPTFSSHTAEAAQACPLIIWSTEVYEYHLYEFGWPSYCLPFSNSPEKAESMQSIP